MIALAFAASLLTAPALTAQLQTPPSTEVPDTVASVAQRDAMDVIARLLHKRVEPEINFKTGLSWAILPTFSYNPVYGAAFGALISGAGQRGGRSARYSNLAISANY